MLTERQLIAMKEEIDNAKAKVSELTGRHKYLMEELKTKWSCSSITEAEKELKNLEKEIETLDSQIRKGMKEVEEKYVVS